VTWTIYVDGAEFIDAHIYTV